MYDLISQAKKAKEASFALMNISQKLKSSALLKVADAIEAHADEILCENQKDLDLLLKNPAKASFYDRLKLTKERL